MVNYVTAMLSKFTIKKTQKTILISILQSNLALSMENLSTTQFINEATILHYTIGGVLVLISFTVVSIIKSIKLNNLRIIVKIVKSKSKSKSGIGCFRRTA